ncbi:MAG: 4-hydroxythreonine-4-phosphate dehydrogenase PdxA [Gammaproteobacteria bacterium]|nr:4-hydroxythreonine-4-phosphate dehydrogenase PdxA [Gammaproteobacteria bacterium]
MTAALPRIGITLGDPAGIGPEILAKALSAIQARCQPVIFGPRWAFDDGIRVADVSLADDPELVALDCERPLDFAFGQVSAGNGEAAIAAVHAAARACQTGDVDAMMTCPLNKEAIHAAGSEHIGHQEMLAAIAGIPSAATMLMTPGLRVVHLSTHKSLGHAVEFVTSANVFAKLQLTHDSFVAWGLKSPRIAVSALNPHGGEGGLLGREEIEELHPAVLSAQEVGIDATGPLPADSVFTRAIDGEFDVVLALYHDQGHIAIKVHNLHESVSATLGLPFIRTSVDHGTAYDIAGQGIANPRSTVAAIDAAITLANGELQ